MNLPFRKPGTSNRLSPARVALLYAAFAALWIVASGALLTFAVSDALLQSRIEIAKGLVFVAVTGGLLYLLLKGWQESLHGATAVQAGNIAPAPKTARWVLLFIALTLVAPLVSLAIVKLHGPQIEREVYANLQAIVRLKAEQIENWLAERHGDSMVLAASTDFAAQADQFLRQPHDARLSKPILARFESLHTAYGYDSILLFDSSGKLLLILGGEDDNTPALQQQLRQALTSSQIQRGNLYRDPTGHIHQDWVVPISGPQGERPLAAVVLRVTANHFLFPLIQTWPAASLSAETLLVRREGESVLFLNELRHRQGTALTLKRSLADPELPAAIALRAARPGITSGKDHRGVSVLAAYRPVVGTGWAIVAKIDRDEVLAPLHELALWVSLVAFSAIIALSAMLLLLWRQQQRMQGLALLVQKTKADRLLQSSFNEIYLFDADSLLFLQVSEGAKQNLGYSSDELSQLTPLDLKPSFTRESFEQMIIPLRTGEQQSLLFETFHRRKDGTTYPVEVRLELMRAERLVFLAIIQDITERKRLALSLAANEARQRTLVQTIPDLVWLKDAEGAYLDCNPMFERFFGAREADIIGKTDYDFIDKEQADIFHEHDRKAMAAGKPSAKEDWLTFADDGHRALFEVIKTPMVDAEGKLIGVLGIARDITEREAAEAKIQRISNLYAALSQCNQAIVRCTNEEELFPQICRIAVEFGGMKMAWIGLIDPSTRMVRPVACFGVGIEFLQDIEVSSEADTPFGRGPVGTSIRENQPFWCQDFMHDPATAPWHERGARVGWASSASLPLHRDGAVIGAFVLHSGEINTFDEAARNLLVGMVTDISFALDNFTRETARKRSEARYRAVAQSANDAIITADSADNIASWNRSAEIIFGYTEAEVMGQPLTLLMPQRYQDRHVTGMHRMLSGGKSHIIGKTVELEGLHKDGSEFPLELSLAKWETAEGQFFTGFIHDISERKQAEAALRQEQQFSKLVLDSLPGIFYLYSYPEMRLVLWNKQHESLLGYETGEMKGRHATDWFAPEVKDAILNAIEVVMEKGQNSIEAPMVTKDGHLVPFFLTGVKFEVQGQSYFIGIGTDISERKRVEESLKNMAARYHTVFELSSDAIMLLNEKGFFDCNEATLRMFGCPTRGDFINKHPAELSPPTQPGGEDSMSLANQRIATAFKNGSNRFEWTHRRLDGADFFAEVLLTVMELDGKLVLQAIVRDISERKQAEANLRIAATAFEAEEGILVTDAHNIILRVNQAFTHMSGYSAEESIGQTPSLLKSGKHDAEFYRRMWEALTLDHYWHGEIWNRRKNGEVHPEWLTISAVTDTEGQLTNYVSTYSDITQHKEDEAAIHSLAFYDPLTSLPNRRLLQDRLQHTLAASVRHHNHGALLFIDLDNFKILNDTKGHSIGDLLLIEVANRLQACVREGDTVARLGGDEFVIMLEELSEEPAQAATQTEAVGDKILAAISQPYLLKGYEYHSSTSIGISLFRDQEITVDELLKRADTAMYQAKDAGRNTLRFHDSAMQAALEDRTALEKDLHNALAENQLRLYYQMQADHSGHILGAEVLIRWQHPQRGLVLPLQFIPLAEASGLILPIGQWVLETACAQLKAWEAGPLTRDLQLAVNVSARQFRQADFVEQVCAMLEKSAVNPDRLKLELTESLVLDNVDDTIVKMQTLKKVGVHFSMDDFGTGYSSLTYLTQLPLDQLKIDQSFVRNIDVKSTDAVIVQTIIGMAENLGMEVIAEGVETEDQRAFLELNGCPSCQGYLFGRPVPVEEFEARLSKG